MGDVHVQYAKKLGSMTDGEYDVVLELDALKSMFVQYDLDRQMQLNRSELRLLIAEVSGGKVQVREQL
jgi:hypothetical protein